ncbi:tRNA-intron lyase [Halalkalirubrum salinum]|uniref:tRNA-intron lyase n=1 Tax=Halalkalirubrum salinum TaxID=2563889 RepID=UPI0010FBA969|nr:tRNA-intron lyase [Halalkalirubrum salinum]
MDGTLREDAVELGGNAKQRFYDARGYGRPAGGDRIELTAVEAAHLLFRGDLDAVVVDGDRLDFEPFFIHTAGETTAFTKRFLVYSDLRDRGFYLSPARKGWPGADALDETSPIDFTVYPRGSGPGDGSVAHRISVHGERERIPAAGLAGRTLAIVDEESEITYFELTRPSFEGASMYEPPEPIEAELIGDRVVCWDPPDAVHERGFYGQPLSGRAAIVEGAIQLSLVEAAGLAAIDRLSVAGESDPYAAIVERGRAVEGERFDRRLAVYEHLRAQDVVPKTGFKFGADFRTYDAVETVSELPHSERLVRVVPPDHVFDPRELSLDVRLAGGVRKRMVFALTDATGQITWLSASRLTP